MRIRIATVIACVVVLLSVGRVGADKRLFTDAFTPAEFSARRAKLMAAIGDGVAIVSGAYDTATYTKFRQNAQFFYLTGVEVPRALLIIDGRTKTSTLFLPPHGGLERSEGPLLGPDEEARKITGIDQVADRATFEAALKALNGSGRTLFMPFRAESLGAGTPDRVSSRARSTAADPWDQMPSKEEAFNQKVKAATGLEPKDLDPIVDMLRTIKSPAEIAVIKEATRIASVGILEAMKSAKPGMKEYELEAVADYFFKRYNSQGIAYFALVATGTNSAWAHYHQAQETLKDGDLVLMDYAPDYQYYTSDVTRMFPANGRFTPRQREMYGIYVKLYQAILAGIGPGPVAPRRAEVYKRMQAIMASFPFTDEKIKAAATRFIAGYERPGTSWGHAVGMEVHDVAGDRDGSMRAGNVFTIEPAFTIPEERIYIRLEDPIVITATGMEHLTSGLPMEIDDIERVMKEPGLADLWKGTIPALERIKK
ncbi:MAG TPA: Xaa-Pro peptidase family protein [Vicinamibacterales bacterium]|nr:Xaa-Pro peptidase family protein [Vicinamibacterales bacterium]